MKTFTSAAIVALVAGTVGFAPAAIAQQAPGAGQQVTPGQHQMMVRGTHGNHRFQMHNARGPGGGALLNLVCSDEAAERAEIGFVRLSYRLELTPEQQGLFDDLKAAALTAQTEFADQCTAPVAATPDAQATLPDPVERLTAQIANDTLRVELMQDLLPSLEALYASLTDEQKASLQPHRETSQRFGQNRRGQMGRPGMFGRPGMMVEPGAPQQPGMQPAPTTPDAPPAVGTQG